MLADSELMARVCEHDVSAFETLSARYWESIYRHVLATIHDSSATEDIVQEVFLRIWTRAEQWHGRGSFKSWLFRIATNLALTHFRPLHILKHQPHPPPPYPLNADLHTPLPH